MPGSPNPLFLDVYGYRVEIRSEHAEALSGLTADFAFFASPDAADSGCTIILRDDDPPYSGLPPLHAVVYTPRNVVYRDGPISYLDYSGRALGVHDTRARTFEVHTRNPDLAYEIAYLFLLSQCGESFDAHGLHRVHALAVSVGDCAGLVLLPMGGGKSTLGASLLQLPDIELLSDDSPLIDHGGGVHAFPLRIGLLPDALKDIPQNQLRRIERMEFGPKFLVNYQVFAHRIRPKASAGVLFLGSRSLGSSCTVTRAPFHAALGAMIANCVVGLGLFQGMEFVFQRGPWEVAAKAWVARRRLMAALRLIRRSRAYHLSLGRDPVENARVVRDTIRLAAGSHQKPSRPA
jgi:hypothetical protein